MQGGGGRDGVPSEGSIEPGIITRIEPYGAFCALEKFTRLQGLIHIRNLANVKVTNVEEVVQINDLVWVKVLSVEESSSGRLRIDLSLKDAAQDGSGRDLGKEQNLQRGKLESNLQQMIGMGVARDPMAEQGLVLKHAPKSSFRGGYELVGDSEGEPELPPEEPKKPLPPMGRGRGMTLPSWMTKKEEGPTGLDDEDNADKGKRERKSSKKHHKKDKKRKHKKHRRDDSESTDDDDRRRRDRRKSSRKHKRHRRRHDDDDDSSTNSDDSSREERKRRKHHHHRHDRKKDRKESHRHRRDEKRTHHSREDEEQDRGDSHRRRDDYSERSVDSFGRHRRHRKRRSRSVSSGRCYSSR